MALLSLFCDTVTVKFRKELCNISKFETNYQLTTNITFKWSADASLYHLNISSVSIWFHIHIHICRPLRLRRRISVIIHAALCNASVLLFTAQGRSSTSRRRSSWWMSIFLASGIHETDARFLFCCQNVFNAAWVMSAAAALLRDLTASPHVKRSATHFIWCQRTAVHIYYSQSKCCRLNKCQGLWHASLVFCYQSADPL